jgi:hypothetical protein
MEEQNLQRFEIVTLSKFRYEKHINTSSRILLKWKVEKCYVVG